ncbi:MAG: hypothetical protein HC809_09455 [Gammaproteobacteria bacterium]|nr:hypothetical protein [Gammaproteobacteria bacterium]
MPITCKAIGLLLSTGTDLRSAAFSEYAAGYYHRAPAAVAQLLRAGVGDRATIEATAREHRVCPFELSLDTAVWADVVVCDYNYVFDPVVRLQRLQGVVTDRSLLLIDEAHQLADRVRDSLSTVLSRDSLSRAVEAAVSGSAVRKAIARFDRRAMKWKRDQVQAQEASPGDYQLVIAWPDALIQGAQRVLDELAAAAHAGEDTSEFRALSYALARLVRTASWFAEERFIVVLSGDRVRWSIDIRCLDPSVHISESLAAFHAHVRFSATLRPMALYARVHGVEDSQAVQLPSPFSSDQLHVSVVRDVSVRYRDRQRSLERLLDVVDAVVFGRSGNYLVALPSFEYLEAAAAGFRHAIRITEPPCSAVIWMTLNGRRSSLSSRPG